MKNGIQSLLILLIGLIAGYALYPFINHTEQLDGDQASKSTTTRPEPQLASPTAIATNSSPVQTEEQVAVTSTNINPAPAQTDKISDSSSPATSDSRSANHNNDQQQSLYRPSGQDQQDAQLWIERHIENIDQLIDTHVPAEIAEGFKSQILKDNPYFDETNIQRDPVEDESWAYIKQREIQTFIEQHELASGFVLYNVSCRQKVCDILGSEIQVGTWMRIYLSFYSAMRDVDIGNQDTGLKNAQYLSDAGTQVYAQLKFK